MQHTASSSSSQVAPLQQLQPDRGGPRTGPLHSPPPGPDSTALRCELPVGAPSQLRFKLPVDVEHKAVQLRLLQLARPHMMAFHLSWICMFLTFTTTFAPAALLPVLQVSYWEGLWEVVAHVLWGHVAFAVARNAELLPFHARFSGRIMYHTTR